MLYVSLKLTKTVSSELYHKQLHELSSSVTFNALPSNLNPPPISPSLNVPNNIFCDTSLYPASELNTTNTISALKEYWYSLYLGENNLSFSVWQRDRDKGRESEKQL